MILLYIYFFFFFFLHLKVVAKKNIYIFKKNIFWSLNFCRVFNMVCYYSSKESSPTLGTYYLKSSRSVEKPHLSTYVSLTPRPSLLLLTFHTACFQEEKQSSADTTSVPILHVMQRRFKHDSEVSSNFQLPGKKKTSPLTRTL